MEGEGLHASTELKPERLGKGVQPVKLTLLFDVVEVTEGTPDGNTVVVETGYSLKNHEYFLDGTQLSYKKLQATVTGKYPTVDLEEELVRLEQKALNDYYNQR